MQISTAITKKTTFASISKTKNGRTMNFVCIHMFSWAKNTMNEHKIYLFIFITKKNN